MSRSWPNDEKQQSSHPVPLQEQYSADRNPSGSDDAKRRTLGGGFPGPWLSMSVALQVRGFPDGLAHKQAQTPGIAHRPSAYSR